MVTPGNTGAPSRRSFYLAWFLKFKQCLLLIKQLQLQAGVFILCELSNMRKVLRSVKSSKKQENNKEKHPSQSPSHSQCFVRPTVVKVVDLSCETNKSSKSSPFSQEPGNVCKHFCLKLLQTLKELIFFWPLQCNGYFLWQQHKNIISVS